MNRSSYGHSRRRVVASSTGIVLTVLLAGCGGAGGTVASSATGGAADTQGKAAAACGEVPTIAPKDPDGAVKALPADLQKAYNAYGEDVFASAWRDKKKLGHPAKVGLSYLPASNAFAASVVKQMGTSFAAAKAKGLVQGTLVKRIMTDPATMTPAEQIRGYNELVDSGVDIIYITPLSGDAMVSAVDAAGKKGVVTVALSSTIRSKYAVNVAENSYLNVARPAALVAKQLDGKGNVVVVRGFQGLSTETIGYKAVKDVLAACPDMKVLGEVNGAFVPPVAKAELLKFLSSHPQKIDMVAQLGVMGSGVYAAFDSTGRKVPKVVDAGASASSLASWKKLEAADGYETAGTGGNGTQEAKAWFTVGMMVMGGEGPKVGTITREPSVITKANLADYLPAGATPSDLGEVMDGEAWMPQAYLDKFFDHPAAPSAN
ncbi:substrate-binding domain-containing protein [Streptomyces sp. NBC_00582]|uniref:substrate-binding domain-containing protein n=1 Tax=Streptomyces sp. NBC_00582 TaxID=2975783 RepID=UPI002E817223|nr:substrate-binding domain-containing protein [Streptomyces sp. NBC_00582]WUB59534.1 substrate-binding domain-containing protein [Streptomyces sp. NBC_00582]